MKKYLAPWLVWFALQYVFLLTGHDIPTWTRMLSSLTLVAVAWWAPIDRRIATGMTLGAIGDLLLAGLVVGKPWDLATGMAAFAAGHLSYIRAMAAWEKPRPSIVIPFLLVGVIAWGAVVQRNDALAWAALGYSFFLTTMTGVAVSAALAKRAYWPVALGAVLFLVSDVVLACELFGSPVAGKNGVWILYGLGQMGIVFGTITESYRSKAEA